jgi:hypothetical protein
MNKIGKTGKIIVIAVVALVVILAIFLYGGSKPANSPTSASSSNSGATQAVANTPSGSGAQPSGSGSNGTRPPVPPPIVIHLITPVAGDQWKIGVTNSISWNNQANFTGEVDLLDAKTGTFIGVILSETGPHQTSYGWDTREYALDRYSPLKKEITPGSYKVRLRFDGNNLSPIISPAFTITN